MDETQDTDLQTGPRPSNSGNPRNLLQMLLGGILPSVREQEADEWIYSHIDGLELLELDDDETNRATSLINSLGAEFQTLRLIEAVFTRIAIILIAAGVIGPAFLWTDYFPLNPNVEQLISVHGLLSVTGGVVVYMIIWFALCLTMFVPSFLVDSNSDTDIELRLNELEGSADGGMTWWPAGIASLYIVVLAWLYQAAPLSTSTAAPLRYLTIALTSLVFIELSTLALVVASAFLASTARAQSLRIFPESVVVSCMALVRARSDGYWQSLKRRAKLLPLIERAASAIDRGLVSRLQLKDVGTQSWLHEEARTRAAAIRKVSRTICLSGIEGETEVSSLCDRVVRAVLDGNWLHLPVAEVSPELPTPITKSFAAVARRLITIGLPLGSLLAIQVFELPLDPKISGYLWTAASIWTVTAIVTIVEPSSREGIGVFREAAEAIRSIRSH
jgi:hypothetical protein